MFKNFVHGRGGATAVEFALIAPVMLTIAAAIFTYGIYFWIGHSLQSLTNDVARATLLGRSSIERQEIAKSVLEKEVAQIPLIEPSAVQLIVQDQHDFTVVKIRYDTRRTEMMALSSLLPISRPEISTSAVIRVSQY